ncbi:cell division control protein 45 [Colletotrichum spaethianum]|uniref:Cell division control protein 45 n=1 Tax=Colletotrichum spaethianum TaxID=700344 RepID=A0AA37LFI1_9PEZI|nr:cell division control protein 45 [Colletotrichum spaethianum]GKT45528.1 cell division control protein 45 [Colletotrichum spaethianum]
MYLPRSLISKLYLHLQNTRHPLSPPVLVLVALEPDALCACRILTRLLKHDYIPHKIQPVSGYADLDRAGRDLVQPMMETQGGSGGVVVCLGVGGMVDLGSLLGLEPEGEELTFGGVEVWVMDSHRPWNLGNVFGGFPLEPAVEDGASLQSRCPAGVVAGRIDRAYKPGKGGIVVFDDGDIEDDLTTEREAYLALLDMPEVDDDGEDLGDDHNDDAEDEDLEKENVLRKYYKIGASFSEPISSMMYSLASELGREDNDLLWLTIVGVTSMELYGRSSAGIAVPVRNSDRGQGNGWMGVRGARIRQLLRDEVRRLNPPEVTNGRTPTAESSGIIPTTARSPEDTSIRLSPEPKFLLIRHWSLYDSMLHSPYLFARLKTWSETGLKRLHKLLAKMGVSLVQCKQSYTHMDMMLKRELRTKLLKYASLYNLDDMVPSVDTDGRDRAGAKDGWGFVRSWGWRATLSAQDVGVVIGALLEVGKHHDVAELTQAPKDSQFEEVDDDEIVAMQGEEWVGRFWEAYDALEDIDALKAGLPTAQFLHRAIYRTGTSLINKKQIKHLRAFRMCVVKEGPDVPVFGHPAALTKLALWVGEALVEQEKDTTGRLSHGGRGTPLVVASLNDKRGVYLVNDEEEEEEAKEKGYGLNRFGSAFQEVVAETNARVRIDSFEHCVVEVKKEDLGGFLESLSMKAVVG